MEVVDFSSNTKSLSAKYIDYQNIDIKNFSSKLEQGITVFDADIFNSVKDVKAGGYSALYLTEQKYGEDILKFKDVITSAENIFITDFIINSTGQNYYFYINTPRTIDANTKTTCKFIPEDSIESLNNIFFELQLIDSRYCRVYHRVNNDIFYLTVNSDLNVFFTNLKNNIPTSLSSIDEYVFSYILDKDQDKLSLYKPVSGNNYNLTIGEDKNFTLTKISSASFIPFNSANTLKVRYNDRISSISPKLNTSWVSYKDVNSLEINTAKSAFKNKNNYLISTQYSFATGNDLEVNILPLKNQLTKEGISQRGDYLLNIPNKSYPQTSLRDYTNIHIGSNSERGIEDISLTYNFYNTEFVFQPDEYTVFKTPDSLYPYTQININDTLFAINGAMGGDSPHSSDKIYTKNIQSNCPNTGTYLCTWLSGGNEIAPGTWVDRYFNTSKISPIEALTATAVKLYDFTSNVEESIQNNTIADDIFFDIKSDLTILPSKEYIYQRIGPNYIKSFVNHLENNTIFNNLTARSFRGSVDIPTNSTETYNFENKYHYNFIDENVSSFTFSFWLETDWEQPFGYQLAGNFNNKGFGIFNDEKITPFIFIPCKDSIYVYNTDFVFLNTIDLGGTVRNIVRINPLDDIYVIVSRVPETEVPELTTNISNVIYKLRSNGTVFDADIIAEVPSYINIFNTETEIYFLINGDGNVAVYNIIEETLKFVTVTIPKEFGVQFDIKSLGLDKFNNLIGFRGEKCVKYGDDEHVFLLRNGILVRESDDHTTRTILLSSSSIVYDFAVDTDENIYVLHNRFISKYNKQRDLIYKISISKYTNISIDVVREYTEDGVKQYPVIMSVDSDDNIFLSKINENNGAISTKPIDNIKGKFYSSCDLNTILNFYNLTNYTLFLKDNQLKNNSLKFRIEIPNKYNNRDNLRNTIPIDISKLSIGKHHFAYRLDTISGNITLFVDGKIIQNVNFDPAEYALDNTLYNNFNVGAATYFNGTILNNYIKQNGYYFCRNIIIEQPRLYSKGVDDIDIKFLNLLNLNIGNLVASLPCGQRNQIDQIQRFFKWQIPGNKSNNINIRVKSNVLTNSNINTVLKEIIRRDISNSLPASVNINDIIFESY